MNLLANRMSKVLVVSLCSSLLVTACTKSSNPTSKSGELRVVTFMEEDWSDQLQVAITDYKSKHPNVNIKLESMPYQNYAEAVKVQMVGGIAADIVMAEPPMVSTFSSAGGIADLDAYLDKPNPYSKTNKPWKEDFVAPFLDSSRDGGGKAKIIPWSLVWVGMFYNQDAYSKAGIANAPKTWNEFLDTNKKLKDKGYTPMYVAIKNNEAQTWWMFQTMLNAMYRPKTEQINLRHKDGWKYDYKNPASVNGESYTVDELYVAFKKGILDPAKSPEYRKAVELMLQMKPYFNSNLLTADGPEIDPKFLTQVSAQKYSGTFGFAGMDSELAKLKKDGNNDKVFKWEIANFPTITKDNFSGLTAGELNPLAGLRNGWVVSKKSKNQDLAVDFLQFMTSADETTKLYSVKRAKKDNTLQPDSSAVANISYAAEAKKVDAGMKFAEMPIFGFGLPPVFDTGKDFEDFHVQWQGLWSGSLTIDQFLEKRSVSSLAALERNLKANQDSIDQKFIDAQLK